MREQARKEGKNPMYNGHCRELGFSNQPGAVVRFKALRTGKTIFEDIVKGPIVIDKLPQRQNPDLLEQKQFCSPTGAGRTAGLRGNRT